MAAETKMDIKPYIGPALTFVFVAGGGWVTLEATANQTDELENRVEVVEDGVNNQKVLEVKLESVEKRLEKMEKLLEKTIEIQQVQMQNQSAICASTGARCR